MMCSVYTSSGLPPAFKRHRSDDRILWESVPFPRPLREGCAQQDEEDGCSSSQVSPQNLPHSSTRASGAAKTQDHRPSKKRRRISFDQSSPTILGSACGHENRDGQNMPQCPGSLWYQADEITMFKTKTRQLILEGFSEKHEDDDLSGLERYSIERSQNKRTVIRSILWAYRKQQQQQRVSTTVSNSSQVFAPTEEARIQRILADPEWVSKVSQSGSASSTNMALVQGFHDFCEVYDPLASLLGCGNHTTGAHSSSSTCTGTNYNDFFFNERPSGSTTLLTSVATRRISNECCNDTY